LKQIVEMLLANGADPNHQDKKGSCALHRAAAQGNNNSVKLLLGMSQKLDLNPRDRWGNTPL
jgi:ankyrin repeat protein